MRKSLIFIGIVTGALLGMLIFLGYGHTFQDRSAISDGRSAAVGWNSFSEKERRVFVEGFTSGYATGAIDACGNTDHLFETHGPIYLENGTLNNPIAICMASLDHFTRISEQKDNKSDYSVYSDVISDFYGRYPKYRNVPFPFLMRQLSDKNVRSADQIFMKFERHEISFTF
jgi:hypothetical protein